MDWSVLSELGLDGALAGRIAVVTGSATGIGQATAIALGRLGAVVVIADIDDAGAASTVSAIAQMGGRALSVHTDVSDEEDVQRLFAATLPLGVIDILINNAVYCPAVPIEEMSAETWDRVMSINLRGTFLLCKAFLAELQRIADDRVSTLATLESVLQAIHD